MRVCGLPHSNRARQVKPVKSSLAKEWITDWKLDIPLEKTVRRKLGYCRRLGLTYGITVHPKCLSAELHLRSIDQRNESDRRGEAAFIQFNWPSAPIRNYDSDAEMLCSDARRRAIHDGKYFHVSLRFLFGSCGLG